MKQALSIALAIVGSVLAWPPRPASGEPDAAAPAGLTLDPFAYSPAHSAPPSPTVSQRVLTLDATTTGTTTSTGAGGTDNAADLAKKLANPVASLISVPLQYNVDFGIGPRNAQRHTLNIQPVIPFALNDDWNLITRTIIPLVCADSPAEGVPSRYGAGDINQSFFFSPKEPFHGWIWGAGPVFLWPSATDDLLGSGKFGAGPTAVLLKQESGWTYGILANHLWSYCGDSDRRSVNATFLQPFLAYQFPTNTTLTVNTESTYDWANRQWTVPVNLLVSQVLKVGNQPISLQIGPRYYAEGPTGGPEWGLRFTLTFLFPR